MAMHRKTRFLILNSTCQDVVDDYRSEMETRGIELVADPAFRWLRADALDSVLRGAHAIVLPAVVPLTRLHMEKTPTLQVLSIASSGFESVDLEAATACGIVVTNAPVQEGAEVVADLTWGLLLSVARQIPYHHQLLVGGRYVRGMGTGVSRKTLGIVGLGNIGKAVARRAKGFDMRLLTTNVRSYVKTYGSNRKQTADQASEIITPHPSADFISKHNMELVSFAELLRQSDFISLHARLNNQTKGLIGARELSLMKPSAFLVNTARKTLVDEAALTEALLNHQIAGAAVDDPPEIKGSPLLNLPNFVCAPHLGNRAIEGVRAVCKCALENALAVVEGRRPTFIVNAKVYEGLIRAPRPGEEERLR